ncbi:uncharacterized protein LOC131525936 [Onychostoma macrolepis]|uniref:Ig-like domain-containing protein n=1 Tax=Onychostoma macrolepis TaxID=369639 RepID=A0A7J6C1W1_9TELE|nr:uncharacterized protein LOC131525936 [Onychostoma macrolepis]KAF4100964.1 hypothetical protein G5714_019160 [Onychostoma macrolepis]
MMDTMEKVMFFCVFSYKIIQITSSDVSEHDVSILRVQLNESITLNCSMTDRYEISWYHQNPESGRLTLLMSAKTSSVAGRKLLVRYIQNQSRLTVKADVGINTVSLVISGLMESDSGLYFCGTKSLEMQFDKPIRLQIEDKLTDREDKVNSVTEPPEDVDITDEVTLTERVLMFGGVGLAVFVFFLATVVAGGIIHYHGWQKGWAAAKRSSLIHHKSVK